MEAIIINGIEDGDRVESRILESRAQEAVANGHRNIVIEAQGQHGIGGRLWKAGDDEVYVKVKGTSGQRLGSLGFPNTTIEVMGSCSDDVGWLNAGAKIIVHGNATNGACNGMAQGKVYVAGNIGARGMTMTKQNPKYSLPELWVLGSTGDSFAEFMAGGVAVVCGVDPVDAENILGDRPCVGMVGGRIFFRGKYKSYSQGDARMIPISDDDWQWLCDNMQDYLNAIGKSELLETLTSDRGEWQLLEALKPQDKRAKAKRSMSDFRVNVWDAELGKGGVVGDLTDIDRSPIDPICSGDLRRFIPMWENDKYLPPCEAGCPTGIPVQKRWELIRNGKYDEAIDLIMHYTPFPATVCGYLCPNRCMDQCTRGLTHLGPLNVPALGKASLHARLPERHAETGKKVAIIGGGPAGLSVAWQLWLQGDEPTIFQKGGLLGGKIASVIPHSRIPKEVLEHEMQQASQLIRCEDVDLDLDLFAKIEHEYDNVVIAAGAQQPRMLPVEGKERALTALEFLTQAKAEQADPGQDVVIIGAGNVGCDVATEAARFGAKNITLIDVQEPASFGKERDEAEHVGAKFRWPIFTKAITDEGLLTTEGELIPADTVIVSIGDQPQLNFIPDNIKVERGCIVVDDSYETSMPGVYAVGDSVRPGLLTDAIGAGRDAAIIIHSRLMGLEDDFDNLPAIEHDRVKLEYYAPVAAGSEDVYECSTECASCGKCRDCGMCEAICPQQAIARKELAEGLFEYVVDGEKCIGCGFCEGACPCGIWELVENEPLGV